MLTYLIVIQIEKTGMLVDQTRADETEIHKTYLCIFWYFENIADITLGQYPF